MPKFPLISSRLPPSAFHPSSSPLLPVALILPQIKPLIPREDGAMEGSCISSRKVWLSKRVISECGNPSDSAPCRHDGDGLLWLRCTQAPLKGFRKRSACVPCVLIISVSHSLCVFMCLIIITVHVWVWISVSQSESSFKSPQGSNYPLNNMRLGFSTRCEIWLWMLIDLEADCYLRRNAKTWKLFSKIELCQGQLG